MWPDQRIWDEVNLPWLKKAMERGDVIRAVSDPLDVKNLFKSIDNIPPGVLTSPELLIDYLKNLDDPDVIKVITFYGREVQFLLKNDYSFDIVSKTFVR